MNLEAAAHNLYINQPDKIEKYIEETHSKLPDHKRGAVFYSCLMSEASLHWGCELKPQIFERVIKHCQASIKIILKPKKLDRFADFLNDAGKKIESKLVEIYSNKEPQYTAMGLIAMYDLGLLKTNPASAVETNQSALVRSLQNDLNPKLTRQALQLAHYSESGFSKHKSERKFHLKMIQYLV
ncbi:MAG: hypothetical protein JST75_14910 [Bacteroidetes bacterium]|nr:hypothetical protein [Bacteroidota bacterium]